MAKCTEFDDSLFDAASDRDRAKIRAALTPAEIDELISYYITSYDEMTGGRKIPVAPMRKKLHKLIGDM